MELSNEEPERGSSYSLERMQCNGDACMIARLWHYLWQAMSCSHSTTLYRAGRGGSVLGRRLFMSTGMPAPAVRNTLVDSNNKTVFHIMTYRQLSRPYLLNNVLVFVSTFRRKPK